MEASFDLKFLCSLGLGFDIDEIVQAWHEMYEVKRWQSGVPSFRLEPLLRRRVSKLFYAFEHAQWVPFQDPVITCKRKTGASCSMSNYLVILLSKITFLPILIVIENWTYLFGSTRFPWFVVVEGHLGHLLVVNHFFPCYYLCPTKTFNNFH